MSRILVTVPACRLTPKGREKQKEIYLVCAARDASGVQQVETPTFYRVERDLFLRGDGVEIYCGEPDTFLQIFLSIVESDSDVREMAGRLSGVGDAVAKLPLPQVQVASMAVSLVAGVLAGNKDDTLYTAAFCARTDQIKAGDVDLPANDRIEKVVLRVAVLEEESGDNQPGAGIGIAPVGMAESGGSG